MIDTVALEPAYSPLGEPVTAMVTGKEATLALLDAAISPTDDTVPYTVVVDPLGVMTAWSPTWIWPTSVSSTVVLTVKEPVDTTTMSLLLLEEDELAADDDGPGRSSPPGRSARTTRSSIRTRRNRTPRIADCPRPLDRW